MSRSFRFQRTQLLPCWEKRELWKWFCTLSRENIQRES